MPDDEGAELCRSRYAVPVVEEKPTEKAVASEPEKRDEQPKRRGGRPPLPRDEDGNIVRD